MTWVSPWWLGITVDHLYETCPARMRSEGELRRVGWWKVGLGELNTDEGDVCGICLRWWRARNRDVA